MVKNHLVPKDFFFQFPNSENNVFCILWHPKPGNWTFQRQDALGSDLKMKNKPNFFGEIHLGTKYCFPRFWNTFVLGHPNLCKNYTFRNSVLPVLIYREKISESESEVDHGAKLFMVPICIKEERTCIFLIYHRVTSVLGHLKVTVKVADHRDIIILFRVPKCTKEKKELYFSYLPHKN